MNPSSLLDPRNRPIPTQKLTLQCPILDHFLAGGIPCNSVTELVGESGSGKTQLCLQLCLSAQLPISMGGLASSSLYLYTEFPFPDRRLRQLSDSLMTSNIAHFNPTSYDPLERVLINGVCDAHQLFDVLLQLDCFLPRKNLTLWPVKLIVIDSIAALFRSEFDNNAADMKKRSSIFFKISGWLRALAKKFGLAVVVTNQVTDVMSSNQGGNVLRVGNLGCLCTSGRWVSPALGLAWANCVNTRLFLSKSEGSLGNRSEFVDENGEHSVCVSTKRHIHVVFAPHLPPSSCEFTIFREGIVGLENNDMFTIERTCQ